MTMSFQAHEGHAARSEDLHRHILRSHLAYLNQEETPAKLEQRRNLEKLITEYLCVVSHSVKFTFIEISNVLRYSIENNPNFSAYKAQSAFEALEKYATNLIGHPWRKEYKTVKLYSGFFKHAVAHQLIHADSVFLLLGYQSTNDSVLYLDEPIDPDKVARVAIDCLIAFVECQIMVQICERVKSSKCSWSEIHGIREDYVCGVDEAVRLLHQLKRNTLDLDKQNHWFRNQENGFSLEGKKDSGSNYPKTGVLVDVSNTWPADDKFLNYESARPSSVSEEPLNSNPTFSHSKLLSWNDASPFLDDYRSWSVSKPNRSDSFAGHSFEDPVQSRYSFVKDTNPVSKYASPNIIPDYWNSSWDGIQSSVQSSSYHRNGSFTNCDQDSLETVYNQTVPNMKEPYSSQLRHLFPSHPIMPTGFHYPLPHDISVPIRQCQGRLCCDNELTVIASKHHPKVSLTNSFESDLRSVGHLDGNDKKDANILAPFSKISLDNPISKPRSFPIHSPHAFTPYQPSKDSVNDVKLRSDAETFQQSTSKRGSYYDNVPPILDSDTSTHVVGQSLNSKFDFESAGTTSNSSSTLSKVRSQKGSSDLIVNSHSLKLPRKISNPVDSGTEKNDSASLNSDSKYRSNGSASVKDSKGNKKWSCSTCTFCNAANKYICDMCGRSKDPGPEVMPLVSGGRECPQCTLVNKKDSENCTACGASLKDSPTYI